MALIKEGSVFGKPRCCKEFDQPRIIDPSVGYGWSRISSLYQYGKYFAKPWSCNHEKLRTNMNTFSQLLAQKPGSLALRTFKPRIFLCNGAAALSGRPCRLTSREHRLHPFHQSAPFPILPQGEAGDLPFQSGGPSQMDLFDPKPMMEKEQGNDLPESIRKGQRLTTMTSGQKSFPIAKYFQVCPAWPVRQWMSELLPHLSGKQMSSFIKSMHTEAINHDPAMTFFQTGHQLAGRPSFGSWVSYGLGASNQDLPSYVVLTSFGSGRPVASLFMTAFGVRFLPTRYQGKFRNSGDAVLYLSDPLDRPCNEKGMLDDLAKLNRMDHKAVGTRILMPVFLSTKWPFVCRQCARPAGFI